ncbi:vitelline membrane outer layer protein 1-like [Xenopus laevis]|uniref:Vitelline membrane outer layer protein 1-like n=2 Tax=Xenopus laevis TaxID=8355 RepID=A0A1L8H3W3_XENLA|nr:vitelline membrane outer layer protein 1-like [Xenopus laevis]OCT90769.1 hypothetical protein XELAEV_18019386mg [Xenopus laevis]
MAIKISLVIFSFFSIGYGRLNPSIINIANGGPWGEWGPLQECNQGHVAKKFSIKIRESEIDKTGLNGIRLYCSDYNNTREVSTIKSSESRNGDWSLPYSCESGYFNSFSLRVESYQGKLYDDKAATNIKFRCSGKGEVEGPGFTWGSYGPWSQTCQYGICGIMTKIERLFSFFSLDHTGLNDVQFHCCPRWGQ